MRDVYLRWGQMIGFTVAMLTLSMIIIFVCLYGVALRLDKADAKIRALEAKSTTFHVQVRTEEDKP